MEYSFFGNFISLYHASYLFSCFISFFLTSPRFSGYYLKQLKKVVTLDNLGSKLNIYNLDCKLEKNLEPVKNNDRQPIILQFAVSTR